MSPLIYEIPLAKIVIATNTSNKSAESIDSPFDFSADDYRRVICPLGRCVPMSCVIKRRTTDLAEDPVKKIKIVSEAGKVADDDRQNGQRAVNNFPNPDLHCPHFSAIG